MTYIKTAAAAALVAVAVGLGGCKSQGRVSANTLTTKVMEAPDPNVVTVPHPEQFALVTVEMRKTPTQLSVNAVISPDISRNVPVNSLTSGRVVEVHARLGDHVEKGQLLMTMTSPDLSSAISDYIKYQADERLAKTQLDREKLLYEHGAVPEKDLQVSEEAYEKAKVDTSTAAQRIQLLGGDLNHLTPLIEIHAPVSGTIVEQNVTNAAGVKSLDNSPNLFTISDLSHVWVLCDVYENNLAQVHLGDRADVQLNAYPDRHLEGRVTNISSMLDPTTRTAKVRVDLPNPNGTLRPNMFATVTFISQGTQSRMVVPVSAVLRLQDRDWVYVKQTNGQFRRTEVQALPAGNDGYQQVLAGVQPGDQVAQNALEFSRAVENEKESAQQ